MICVKEDLALATIGLSNRNELNHVSLLPRRVVRGADEKGVGLGEDRDQRAVLARRRGCSAGRRVRARRGRACSARAGRSRAARRRGGRARVAGGSPGRPSIRAIAGRRKRWAQTSAETGLPGRPIIGVAPRRPARSGLPGRMAMRWNSRSRPRASAVLRTRSKSPTEAPPRVTIRSAPPRRARGRRRGARGCRGRWAGCSASAPAASIIAFSPIGVRGEDLVGAGGVAGHDELVAGRDQRDGGAAGDGDAAGAHRREERDVGGAEAAGGGDAGAGGEVAAGGADVGIAVAAVADGDDAAAVGVGVLLDERSRSAPSGTGAPVKMRTASPAPTLPAKRRAGGGRCR